MPTIKDNLVTLIDFNSWITEILNKYAYQFTKPSLSYTQV
jgi:hypothetical protein